MKAHAHPQVTVVIPVWGQEARERLGHAVASVRDQDCPAEIVVVDNACDPPLEPLPETRLVTTGRRVSLGAARDAGLHAAATPLVMLFDADDVMLPGALARLVARMERDPRLAACSTTIVDGGTGERHHWPRRWPLALSRFPTGFAVLNAVTSLYPTTGALLRTDAARDARIADVDAGDDWILGVALAFRGSVAVDPVPGRLYTRRGGSISAAWTTRDILGHARAVRHRLTTDPAVPPGVRRLVPLVALGQLAVLLGLRPLARRTPRRRREG